MTGTVLQPIFLQLTVYFLLSHEFYLNFGVWRSDADFFGHESPVRTNYFMQFTQLFWKEKEGDLICILLFCKCLQDGILSLNYYLEIPGDSKRHHPFPHPATLQERHESWVQNHHGPASPLCGGKWLPAGMYLWWHGGYGNLPTSGMCSLFSVAVCSPGEFCLFFIKYLCPFLSVVSFLMPSLCAGLQLLKAKAASKFLLITRLWQCNGLLHSVAFKRILLCKLYHNSPLLVTKQSLLVNGV